MNKLLPLSLCLGLLMGCGGGDVPIPKPRSYPRVMYPEQAYESTTTSYCNFRFDRPKTATLVREELFFEEVPPDSCWFDLRFTQELNGSVH
ncbi:MAG: gliding motility protein GldD, partial [Bacteroidota bacterium]